MSTPAPAFPTAFDRDAALSEDWVWTFSLGSGPHASADSTTGRGLETTAVCAGEFVNLDMVRAELRAPSESGRDALVACAFDRWGVAALSRLRGRFAVAAMSRARDEIIVARDHVGLQPVFYTRHGHAISFAASPHRLRALPGVSREFNRIALADSLCRRSPDPEETLFEGIWRLPAGCFARIARGVMLVERHWDPFTAGDDAGGPDEALERFEYLQTQAVERCLTQTPAAIFLSGGLDSVSIAAVAADVAARASRSSPLALSLAMPDPDCDERALQIAVAGALGLEQELMDFNAAVGDCSLFDQALALNRHLSSPLLNVWWPPYLALAGVGRARGIVSVLTGVGGDEWLSASPYVVADRLASGHLLGAWRFVREWNRSEDGRGLVTHRGLRPLAGLLGATVAPQAWDRRRARRLVSGDPVWLSHDPELRAAQVLRAESALGPARPVRGFAASDTRSSLTSLAAQAQKEEYCELGRVVGVKFCHPYCDPDLLEFLARVPIKILNTGGWLKGLLRRQLAKRLPALGFERQRKVLATGFHRSTMSKAWQELSPQSLRVVALSRLGVVDDARMAEAMPHLSASAKGRSRLWDLLNLETWVRAHA